MELLDDVAHGTTPFDWVDADRRARARSAFARGIRCLLDSQVVVDGTRTAWCAQHDERTLEPRPARAFEKVSLSGSESVGLVELLMRVENPGPEVVAAVDAAVAWLSSVALHGLRVERRAGEGAPGDVDVVVVPDPSAPPIWACFYEIGTNRPIFCGRDSVVRYRLDEIEHERRVGYAWYVTRPARLLEKDYPAWKAKLAKETR